MHSHAWPACHSLTSLDRTYTFSSLIYFSANSQRPMSSRTFHSEDNREEQSVIALWSIQPVFPVHCAPYCGNCRNRG
jgi:hypothetical protein